MIGTFVPGRLCLFGEHSDWAGGYRTLYPDTEPGFCITAGTDQGISGTASPCSGRFRAGSCFGDSSIPAPLDVAFTPEALAQVAYEGGFWSYAAGTALAVLRTQAVDGLELTCTAMDLPMRKGLSSSAAICVTVARAFNQVYGLGLGIRDEMEIAYRGETLTPSRCGRMDQVCAYGRSTNLLTFDGDTMLIEPIGLGGVFHLLIVDLGGSKDTIRILRDLNDCFGNRCDSTASGVRRALGSRNREITLAAKVAIERGDASTLGSLMREAQETFDSLVAPACPDQLSSPRLHRVLSCPPLLDLIYGGKGVGSQGDGCAQLVCRGGPDRKAARALIQEELGMGCLDLTISPINAAASGG
jgi:galactokinase